MKCPKCSKDVNFLYIEQDLITTAKGIRYKNGNVSLDIPAGYTLLDNFIENMLAEIGDQRVLGCEVCYKEMK